MDIQKIDDLLDEVISAAHAAGYQQARYEQAQSAKRTADAARFLHENTVALCQRAELRDALLREITATPN